MTTLSPVPDIALRPVPLRLLGWVAYRRYRSTLLAVVAVLAAASAYLIVDGMRMRSAYASYLDCSPANSARCQFAWQNFRDGYAQPGLLGVILMLLPGIVGVFAGAPVLARELETGTFRYAWTQGVGRMRWAVALLVPGAVVVAGIMAAFGALVSWHNEPLSEAGIVPRLRATVFPVIGLAAAGWALAGFALAVLAGLLWRRVLPGLASAGAAWFGAAFVVGSLLRPNYLSPLTTTSLQFAPTDLGVDQWWTKAGARVGDAQIDSALQAVGASLNSGSTTAHPGSGDGVDPVQYLLQHGYTQVTSYQPDSRYWPFQWIEFGWLVALSLLLIVVALWLIRRRPV